MSKLFATERRQKIMEMLTKNYRITVRDLAHEMNVSEVTLRTDLKEMEKEGLLQRTHGGAVLSELNGNEITFSTREKKNKDAKVKIAKLAIDLIEDGNCILLDASSTALELARLLKDTGLKLTVVTSGIYTALELRENTDLTVILLGGVVRPGSSSLEGILGANVLDQIHVDLMFTSANGFTLKTGLTDFNVYEVELKRLLVKKADHIIALVDHSKINKSSISSFAAVKDLSYFISDVPLSLEMDKYFAENGVKTLSPVSRES
ncbi:DeoR/GlpR family DNA-binding transcription regulator (plasmid) [Pseudalkalibacillus hwajinpoensis]|uniref:DeoR/GlpR family DNA-binding transcription regulator n=1 Tax=Guptibacillus hwajinpoensis TaxID=208199 RepID=UPI00325B0889